MASKMRSLSQNLNQEETSMMTRNIIITQLESELHGP